MIRTTTPLLTVLLALLLSGCVKDDAEPGELEIGDSNAPEEAAIPNLTGELREWGSGARVTAAVVRTEPPTRAVRVTAQGQYAIDDQIVPGEIYLVIAEAEGYGESSSRVRARADASVRLDIEMLSLTRPGELVARPNVLYFDAHTRRINFQLENRGSTPLGWTMEGLTEWLVVSAAQGFTFQGGPEVMSLQVRGDRLPTPQDSEVALTILDEQGGEAPLLIFATPQDPALVELTGIPEETDASARPGGDAKITSQVTYDGAPVSGERVTCEVLLDGAPIGLPVVTESDLDGRAVCFVEVALEGEVTVAVTLPWVVGAPMWTQAVAVE